MTNCCVFVEDLLVGAFGTPWNVELHDLMMINKIADDRFGPITAAIRAGMATRLEPPISDQIPLSWTEVGWSIAQGWRKSGDGADAGHAFLVSNTVVSRSAPLAILEANRAYKLNGVGWRGIGKLRDVGIRPKPSDRAKSTWTWGKIRAFYTHGLRIARLNVGNLQ